MGVATKKVYHQTGVGEWRVSTFSVYHIHMKKNLKKVPTLFKEKVMAIVKKIPKGKTMTYKQVAIKAGKPNASRAVGGYMSKNADKTIPCHRVIRADGKMGGYNGLQSGRLKTKKRGGDAKLELLRREGAAL